MIFDWFKKPAYSNVVKFPEIKTPYVEPPKQETSSKTYYTFGLTDDNRMAFAMGYTTLTMNEEGVLNLIEALELFARQTRKKDSE
jgi:hypothetical protein